jgi:hypothetical protein
VRGRTVIIALASTGTLSEIEELASELAKLKSSSKRCPFTGKRTLADALTAILDSEELSSRLLAIWIERSGTQYHAEIIVRKTPGVLSPRITIDKIAVSEFGVRFADRENLTTRTSIYLHWLREVER